MTEKDLGVDQEGATASPPLINDKNQGRASKLLPLFTREMWVEGQHATEWVESQSPNSMRDVVREAMRDEYREGTAPSCEFTVDEAMDAFEYVVGLYQPRFQNAAGDPDQCANIRARSYQEGRQTNAR